MCGFLKEVRTGFCVPVVMVTHDPAEARSLADLLIVYDNGRVVQTGTPGEVFASPATPDVARLVEMSKGI
jgi:ABC-type sulfate/molybdate transport systems ATPase subunit